MKVIAVVGGRKSGKTTLIEGLVRELSRLGYRVAVLKHIHHDDFEFDVPGKDTWRAARAGAIAVVGASGSKSFIELRGSIGLRALLRAVEELAGPELALLEGFSEEIRGLEGVGVISMGGRELEGLDVLCECGGPGDLERALEAVRSFLGATS